MTAKPVGGHPPTVLKKKLGKGAFKMEESRPEISRHEVAYGAGGRKLTFCVS